VKLGHCRNIVILTGAGISKESGIKTFRDHNGLWENHAIEDVASPEGFARDPHLVQHFYNLRREQLKEVEPNEGHLSLARLEETDEFDVTIITQNVDDLHERAGSNNVIHMHGELRKIRHLETGEIRYHEDALNENEFHLWRPHIVWFGENIMHSEKIFPALENADLFMAIGTSGLVYPAAGFAQFCQKNFIPTVELNLEATGGHFDLSLEGKATKIIPKFVKKYLK
jgi:NAD-dependent deacetylase